MTDYENAAELTPHTIVARVEDRPGVLHRIVSIWQEKGYNIRSLAVGSSEQPGHSRMTFVVEATSDAGELVSDLRAMPGVDEIRDISGHEFVSRELALIRVAGRKEMRQRLMEVVDIFNARILDVAPDSMIIEVTGHEQKINSLVRLLGDYDVVELVRTGRVSMLRGSSAS